MRLRSVPPGIDALESTRYERRKILYDNLARIDDDVCRADSDLYHVRVTHPYEPRLAEGIERTLFNLEEQKRLERGGAWEDLWLVNKELLEQTRQYQQLTKRDLIVK